MNLREKIAEAVSSWFSWKRLGAFAAAALLAVVGAFTEVAVDGGGNPASAAAALHPCRNWQEGPVTTADFRRQVAEHPACSKAWAASTGASTFVSSCYNVVREYKLPTGSIVTNTAYADNGSSYVYKYVVQADDVWIDVLNSCTHQTARGKRKCLNVSPAAPVAVVKTYAPLPALVAWSSSTSTSQSGAKVKVICNGTVVIVDARAFAEAVAKAKAKGSKVVTLTGTNTRTGVVVTVVCNTPKVPPQVIHVPGPPGPTTTVEKPGPPGPTVTVEKPVPGPTVTVEKPVPGPTVTVEKPVPGPTVTVTVTVPCDKCGPPPPTVPNP